MKIVINTCFGGFGISAQALKALAMANADCIEKMTPKYYYGGEGGFRDADEWERRWDQDFARHKDIGDGFSVEENDDGPLQKDGLLYMLKSRSDERMRISPDLVSVVEALGDDANGRFAELKVVEIPDGIEFTIEEYDGAEHISEAHQTWS